jgi:hypothetical protein
MRSSINITLQTAVLVVATLMRFAQPGWLLITFVISIVGPVLVAGHVVLAMTALNAPRLPRAVAVPFLVAAVSLLAANLLLADVTDARGRIPSPLESVTGFLSMELQGVGFVLLLVWGGSVVWIMVAMLVKRAAFRRVPVGSPA